MTGLKTVDRSLRHIQVAKNHLGRALRSVHSVQPRLEDGPQMRELAAYIRAAKHCADEVHQTLQSVHDEIVRNEGTKVAAKVADKVADKVEETEEEVNGGI